MKMVAGFGRKCDLKGGRRRKIELKKWDVIGMERLSLKSNYPSKLASFKSCLEILIEFLLLWLFLRMKFGRGKEV